MIRRDTWYESELPKRKNDVTSRQIHTIKYLAHGNVEGHNSRFVARWFTQIYGENYGETFAHVAKLHQIQIVLRIATNIE